MREVGGRVREEAGKSPLPLDQTLEEHALPPVDLAITWKKRTNKYTKPMMPLV